ncbi:MAG: peptidyl-prolyl cis-trans isomerase [Candidatus Sumerlaeia bacterium]|nr:peptidyl-prolyl cis-trans isomerase [Candidatus Sumerlaeia bacterium]
MLKTPLVSLCALSLIVGGWFLPPTTLQAQEVAPLILDERPGMTIRERPREERQRRSDDEEPKKTDESERKEPVATPSPSDVIVAVVNTHRLTRESLNARVAERFEKYKKELEEGKSRTLQQVRDVFGNDSQAARIEIAQEMEDNLEAAMRAEEGAAVRDWVDHLLLADEARRQGILINQNEYRQRLQEITEESNLQEDRVTAVLADLRISQRDFQQTLYDAMLIERLVDQFIRLNWSEEDLREAFNSNRNSFYYPPRHHIAHFSIALDGSETNDQIRRLEELARRVRTELRRDADPEALFAKDEFSRVDMGIWGTTGFFTFQEGNLPRPIEAEAQKLSAGQTSDVLINRYRDARDRIRPRSIHVIKVLSTEPARGDTFESALPIIRERLVDVARDQLLQRIRTSGTHRIITNLGGIPPEILPSQDDLQRAFAQQPPPLNLRLGE